MSVADGQASRVSTSGSRKKGVTIDNKAHVATHSWRPAGGRGVELFTSVLDGEGKNGPIHTTSSFVENDEDAMRSAAEDMAQRVVKSKQDWLLRTQQGKAGGGSSSGGTRKNADVESADPVIMASRVGGRVRSGVATNRQDEVEVDWRKQPADTFLASMDGMVDGMGVDEALEFLASNGCKAAKEILRELQDLRAKAAVGVALERAIKAAEKHNKTEDGHRRWQTLLTAAAFPRRANDHQEEEEGEEEEEETTPISGKRKAASVGDTEQAWCYAVKRAKLLRADLKPTEAIKRGFYWFSP